MKIVFNRKMIEGAVQPLMCAVSGKATLTAVEGILFEADAENATCTMTTFDLEKGMRVQVKADVQEGGSCIINAQKFSQTVRVMEGDSVTLTVDANQQACISSGKASHRMNTLPASDFPKLPPLLTPDGFEVSQSALRRLLAKTMYAMTTNDQRQVLNGCFLRVEDDSLLAVACDSFRLARCSLSLPVENRNEDGTRLNFSVILPTKSVGELFRMLKDDERESVRVYLTRKTMIFYFADYIFFTRLVEGVYIDFDRLILTNHRNFCEVERQALIAALERAALVTEERVAGSVRAFVKLELHEDTLRISATSALGSTNDELWVEHVGEDLVIAFNNRFLLDSLRACTAEKVRLSMTSALTSINIEPSTPKPDETELFMLLPVRMKE